MLKELVIYLIFAKDCKDCDDMRDVITDAIDNSSYGKRHCTIEEIDSSKDEAIEIAIDNDIDDLPACVIGNFSFCGKNGYNYDSILDAIEKTWEDSGDKDEAYRGVY
jgi:hypothetical protein